MTLSTDDCLAAITRHSRALAEAARVDLTAPVEHCPGWTVADLVQHVTEVHWFWRTIAEDGLAEPPSEERRPARVSDHELVDNFVDGAERLVGALRAADQAAAVWTWFPLQQDVAFITRHQVQEAVVHHFDAAHAADVPWTVAGAVAADAVEEFLTTSLADDEDVVRIGTALPGPLSLAATDTGLSWTVHQPAPGSALAWRAGHDGAPTVSGPVADLLLWVYQRTDLPVADRAVVDAFRRLSSTD